MPPLFLDIVLTRLLPSNIPASTAWHVYIVALVVKAAVALCVGYWTYCSTAAASPLGEIRVHFDDCSCEEVESGLGCGAVSIVIILLVS
jgi:hypothetical protein